MMATTDTTATVLEVLARHIDRAEAAIGESRAACERLTEVSKSPDEPPLVTGRASGYATLAQMRWSHALGARAALEGAYQELSGGRPSPAAAATNEILARVGLGPNPVGLEPLHPHVVAFLDGLDA
jgi:hypothetical protein